MVTQRKAIKFHLNEGDVVEEYMTDLDEPINPSLVNYMLSERNEIPMVKIDGSSLSDDSKF